MELKTFIKVTDHAHKRGLKRANMGGNQIVRFAQKALTQGANFNNSTGELLEFIKSKYHSHYRADKICIYGHQVYIMKTQKNGDLLLLTVLDLPEPLKKYWKEWKDEKIGGQYEL